MTLGKLVLVPQPSETEGSTMNHLIQIVVAATTAALVLASPNAVADDQKSILVTGASTGIGRHLAETLAENGYHVYAGARKSTNAYS